MIGVVEHIETKTSKNGKTFYVVTINGKDSTTFDSKILESKGKKIEAKIISKIWNDKTFFNIDTWCYASEKKESEKKENGNTYNKNLSVQQLRSFALAYAKDLAIAKMQAGIELKSIDIITVATIFESYLLNGATVTKTKEPDPTEPDFSGELSDEEIPFN